MPERLVDTDAQLNPNGDGKRHENADLPLRYYRSQGRSRKKYKMQLPGLRFCPFHRRGCNRDGNSEGRE